jgi:hypothetical protein
MTRSAKLSASVCALLDGTALESKVGIALQLAVSNDEDWPRVASISVGEVLAVSDQRLLFTLYTHSRTALTLADRGRGLLLLVDEGAIVKVEFDAASVGSGDGRTTFDAAVRGVERDEVPYARVSSGIEFQLVSHQAQVLDRWRSQLDGLKELAS